MSRVPVRRVCCFRLILAKKIWRETSAYPKSTSGRSGAAVEMITGVGLLCSFACSVRPAASSIATRQVPTKILTHLSRQLELSPVLFVSDAERSATEYDYQERIRQYLDWQAFDERAEEQLTRWLEMRAAEGAVPTDLLQQAESLLRSWHVVLPASSTLERLVASAAAQTQQAVFVRIAEHLSPTLCEDLDALLNVAPGDYRSALLRLKEYPPEASAAAILGYVTRYRQVSRAGHQPNRLRNDQPRRCAPPGAASQTLRCAMH